MYIPYVVDIKFLQTPNIPNEYSVLATVDFTNLSLFYYDDAITEVMKVLKECFPNREIMLINVNTYINSK